MDRANLRDPALWDRIAAFDFDGGTTARPFAARLAETCGWTARTARAAIEEYRRFLYLATVAEHPVTPSVAVDLVWHLHLTDTRGYWERLCGDTLGRPLHHVPSRGGSEEAARYRKQYEDTLAGYERAFGEAPPSRLWPHPDIRFAPRGEPRLYAPATHYRVRRGLVRGPLAALGGAGLLWAGGGAAGGLFLAVGGLMIVGGAVVTLAALVGATFGTAEVGIAYEASGGDGDGDGGGCGD